MMLLKYLLILACVSFVLYHFCMNNNINSQIIAFGMCLGLLLGTCFNNLELGLCIGTLSGIVYSITNERRGKEK